MKAPPVGPKPSAPSSRSDLESLYREVGALTDELARMERHRRSVVAARWAMLAGAAVKAVLPAALRRPSVHPRVQRPEPWLGVIRAGVVLLVLRRMAGGAPSRPSGERRDDERG